MRLFSIMKVRKGNKKLQREESKKQEQLIAQFMQQHDKHGFPVRTRWPD